MPDPPRPPPAVVVDRPFQFTNDNAQQAVTTALGLIQQGGSDAHLVVAAAQHFATTGSRGLELLCQDAQTRAGSVGWADRDSSGLVSPGDTFQIEVDFDACEEDVSGSAANSFQVTAYAADKIGVVNLAGRLSISSTTVHDNAPATDQTGSVSLTYSSPESFSRLELADMELTATAAGTELRFEDGRQILLTDLAAQTDTAWFAGRVEDDTSGAAFRFDTLVDFRRDGSIHPSEGQFVLDAGTSKTRIRTLQDSRRRAYVDFAVDLEGNGRYGSVQEVRWNELIPHPELLFRPFLVRRGYYIQPLWPRTDRFLTATIRISRDDLPADYGRVAWYRNGQRIEPDSFPETLQSRETAKGDFIEVRLTFDGAADATRIGSATIHNSPPRLSIDLAPQEPDGADDISVVATTWDADADAVDTTYRWDVNGARVPGVDTATLPKERHSRGDTVRVTVAVDDGEAVREESLTVKIVDAEPRIVAEGAPGTVAHGQRLEFGVSVADPDGDEVDPGTLRIGYGPAGMAIDAQTGLVTWRAELPMFDRTLDVHWQVSSSRDEVAPASGTITVVDESRRYPLLRTDLQRPRRLQVGDLDGDGGVEMLVLGADGPPHVLEWNGEDYVQTWAYPFPVGDHGGGFDAVAHGDIDGDGRHEIFVAAQQKLVRLDGVGRRQAAAADLPDGLICTDLAVADLDGDGNSELVCTANMYGNVDPGTTSRLLVFAPENLKLAWDSGEILGGSMAVGNVDRDEALEIVTNGGYVFDGSSFALEWRYEARYGFGSPIITLGDIDGDGVDEILSGQVFSALTRERLFLDGLPTSSEALVAADVLGDDRAEILAWRPNRYRMAVYRMDTSSGAAVLAYETSLAEFSSYGVVAGDLDRDGRVEILAAGSHYSVFEPETARGLEWERAAPGLSWGYRGGFPDLAATAPRLTFVRNSDGEPTIVWFPIPGTEDGSELDGIHTVYGPVLGTRHVVADMLALDADGNGTFEALVSTTSSGGPAEIHLFEPASNQWSLLAQLAHPGARKLHSVARADVNGDGFADILVAGEAHSGGTNGTNGTHAVAFDIVNNRELFRAFARDMRSERTGDIVGADFDGDGRAEIVLAAAQHLPGESRRCLLLVYARQPDAGGFARSDHPTNRCSIVDLVARDFDGDGRPEVAYAADGSRFVGRLNTDFELINDFEILPDTSLGVRIFPVVDTGACADCSPGLLEARTLLVATRRLGHHVRSRLAAYDVTNGGMIWRGPWLLGVIRDVHYVPQGRRWAIATTEGMYLTR